MDGPLPLCRAPETPEYIATFYRVQHWVTSCPGVFQADSEAECIASALAAFGVEGATQETREDFVRALFRSGYQFERRSVGGSTEHFVFVLPLPERR
jgi:hypothetical protein